MKYFVAIALIAAVASAEILLPNLPVVASDHMAEVMEIIQAIQSPSTNPATAAALLQMLQDVYGLPSGIIVGPAIVDPVEVSPIHVGPEIIDFVPEVIPSPVIVAPNPVPEIIPSPVIVAPAPVAPEASSAPLVQIILNINQAQSEVAPAPVLVDAPVAVDPVVVVDQPAVVPDPVIIVDTPVHVAPVIVLPQPEIIPEPVIIGEPVIPEPVIIGTPVLPTPVVTLPETLN